MSLTVDPEQGFLFAGTKLNKAAWVRDRIRVAVRVRSLPAQAEQGSLPISITRRIGRR